MTIQEKLKKITPKKIHVFTYDELQNMAEEFRYKRNSFYSDYCDSMEVKYLVKEFKTKYTFKYNQKVKDIKSLINFSYIYFEGKKRILIKDAKKEIEKIYSNHL